MEMNNGKQIEHLNNKKTLTTFPFSKTTCVCNCGKYNLNELPKLRNILPENYEYKLCEYLQLDREDKFLVTLRMTLSTKDEALEWKRLFEEKSLTTHVKDKTYPNVERVSVFKAQYRCQFFDRRKNKKKLPEKSKFRDCHSILFINIKKYFRKTIDHHMPKYKMVVRLHYAHDHPLDTADVLKKRHLNEDIKQRFLEMFRQGMKPKDALDKHKKELLQRLGPEKYRQVVCDGYYVPNVPKIYRLYYQIHGKGVSAKTTTKRSSRHNPNPDWIAFQNCQEATNDDDDCENISVYIDDENLSKDKVAVGVSLEASLANHSMVVNTHCNIDSESSLPDNLLEHGLNAGEILDPKVLTDEIGHAHSIMNHDGELQKLAETAIAYPSIAAHNSVYNDLRSLSLSAPTSSFSDAHLGMSIYNTSHQTSWDNFNAIQQAAVLANNLNPVHQGMDFQNLLPQNSQNNYMALSLPSCEDPSFLMQQSVLDQKLPNSLSQNTSEYELLTSQQCTWSHERSHTQLNSENVTEKVTASTYMNCHNHSAKKSCMKKYIQKKKRKPTKELNMKHVTKKWMERKPKVEVETQNMASEVVQSILLTDEAEKLNVKLVTFFNNLQHKMVADPKMFVPAIRSFIHAAESAVDDAELVSFLKDFKKTEENICKSLLQHKQETIQNNGTQTPLSGPVVKLNKLNRDLKKKVAIKTNTKCVTRKKITKKQQILEKGQIERLVISKSTTNSNNRLYSFSGQSHLNYVENQNVHFGDHSSHSHVKSSTAGMDQYDTGRITPDLSNNLAMHFSQVTSCEMIL